MVPQLANETVHLMSLWAKRTEPNKILIDFEKRLTEKIKLDMGYLTKPNTCIC